jgi:hypothetical protein
MTLSEFKTWALSQGSVAKFDDGQFLGECVSLVNQYAHRVLGVPAGAWGNAGDWATSSTVAKYFDKVSTIKAGDILVYPSKAAPYGHIAIALNGSQMLDQNGDFGRKVAVRNIWANPVILRRKGSNNMTLAEARLVPKLDGRTISDATLKSYIDKGNGTGLINQLIKDSAKHGKDKRIADLTKALNDTKVALANEKNKPPQTVIKEVEKIVEKIVEVEKPQDPDSININKDSVWSVVKRFFGKE